jgi:hypothetical protein
MWSSGFDPFSLNQKWSPNRLETRKWPLSCHETERNEDCTLTLRRLQEKILYSLQSRWAIQSPPFSYKTQNPESRSTGESSREVPVGTHLQACIIGRWQGKFGEEARATSNLVAQIRQSGNLVFPLAHLPSLPPGSRSQHLDTMLWQSKIWRGRMQKHVVSVRITQLVHTRVWVPNEACDGHPPGPTQYWDCHMKMATKVLSLVRGKQAAEE